jgi:hypothetical protein
MFENSVIKGLLVTLNNDEGPKVLINFSELNELLSMKLAIMGMTVFMFGNEKPDYFANKYYKAIGYLPIPSIESEPGKHLNSDYCALALIFNVKNDIFTHDQRAMKYGRDAIVWFLFEQSNRKRIFNLLEKIEEISHSYLKDIKYESQIYQKYLFLNYLKDVQRIVGDLEEHLEFNHISDQ